MTRAALILLAVLLAPRGWGAPPDAVAAALADAKALPPAMVVRTRYLDLTGVAEDAREELRAAVAFWVNSLSRESVITPPREVNGTLLAVVIDDYGWDASTFGDFGDPLTDEPYYHVRVRKDKEVQSLPAPWLGAAGVELAALTKSRAAIVRADWFLHQTAAQANRDGHGYYDWFKLGRQQSDFHKLVGVNSSEAVRLRKETAAAIGSSIVTLNNRAIHRLQAVTGPYFFTSDYQNSKDRRNTLRLLDSGTDPPFGDASEQYGTLPNGLFAFWLQDGQGRRQDSAPDFIASDGRSTSTDRRVHVGISCVRCHVPGIQPIADFARSLYQRDISLASPDYERLKRLRQLYLTDLPALVARDQADYAAVVKRCNGRTPAQNAAAFAKVWADYERPLMLPDLARELGCPPEKLTAALTVIGPTLDPILAGLLQNPPIPIRRDHAEELFSQAMDAITRHKP